MKTKRLLLTLFLGLSLTLAVLGTLNISGVLAAEIGVTIFTDGGTGSLRAAISTANSNGEDNTITLPAGTYTLTLAGTSEESNATGDLDITSSNALTITGAGAGNTIINANGIDRVMHIHTGTVVISGVTIYNGSLSGSGNNGGGIYNDDADLILINTSVYSNSAYYGGGVYVAYGSATLTGTQVLSNSALFGGGVFVVQGSATLNMNGGEVNSNSAYDGGGVYVYSGSATLTGTQVNSNSASSSGGGVFVVQGSATLTGTQVNSNSASYGGGVCVGQGSATLSMNGGGVNSNSALFGGGVFVDAGSATLTGTQVNSNSANYGGGVYVSTGSATLTGTQVLSNSASSSGGGVYVSPGSATLTGTQVLSNSASYGGGVYVGQGSATLTDTQVTSNTASDNGGGMYVYDGSATLTGTQVFSNSASYGGGVYVNYGSVTLTDTQVTSNTASDNGGGMYIYGGSATLTGTQVNSNSADWGGGLYVTSGSVTLTDTQVTSNTASDNGGGLYLSFSGAITASNGCIVNNSDTAIVHNNITTGTLNAGDNWWGAADGPGGEGPGNGDTVGEGVDYTPFKTIAPAGCPDKIQPAPEIDVQGNGVSIPNGDATPSTADDTDFGRTAVSGGAVAHTFTISNTGDANLNLTGTPAVTLTTGVHFTVTAQPASPVISNSATTFDITFDPTAAGAFTDTVIIMNNDADENPYIFVISGTGTAVATAPEIDVQGNGQSIPNGDATPTTTDGTDFGRTAGSGGTVVHTFTISNTGDADLNLTGTPAVTLTTGTHFSVSAQPASPVISNSATTFDITFDPTAAGAFTDTVTIMNNDADENPYTFVIAGTAATAAADLSITKSAQTVDNNITFTIAVRNLGPDVAGGAVVSDTLAATSFISVTWTCSAAGGAACGAASGGGDIQDTLATFPAGGGVTYTVQCTLVDRSAYENVAEISVPASVFDPDMSNNRAVCKRYQLFLPLVYKNWTP